MSVKYAKPICMRCNICRHVITMRLELGALKQETQFHPTNMFTSTLLIQMAIFFFEQVSMPRPASYFSSETSLQLLRNDLQTAAMIGQQQEQQLRIHVQPNSLNTTYKKQRYNKQTECTSLWHACVRVSEINSK